MTIFNTIRMTTQLDHEITELKAKTDLMLEQCTFPKAPPSLGRKIRTLRPCLQTYWNPSIAHFLVTSSMESLLTSSKSGNAKTWCNLSNSHPTCSKLRSHTYTHRPLTNSCSSFTSQSSPGSIRISTAPNSLQLCSKHFDYSTHQHHKSSRHWIL
jgi:hypothetical protein